MKSVFRILFIITCITSLIGCEKNEEKPIKKPTKAKKSLKIEIPQQAVNEYGTPMPKRVSPKSTKSKTDEELLLERKLDGFYTSLSRLKNSFTNRSLTTNDLSATYYQYEKYVPLELRPILDNLNKEDLEDLKNELLGMPGSYIPVIFTAIQLMGELAMTAEATLSYERNYLDHKKGYTLSGFNELKDEVLNYLKKTNKMIRTIEPNSSINLPEDYETFKLEIKDWY